MRSGFSLGPRGKILGTRPSVKARFEQTPGAVRNRMGFGRRDAGESREPAAAKGSGRPVLNPRNAIGRASIENRGSTLA